MPPSLSEILDAVAARGSIESAASALGLEPARVRQALKDAARRLAPRPSTERQASLFEPPAAVKERLAKAPPPPEPPKRPEGSRFEKLVVHSDGAARGNPGPSGAGAVVSLPDGTVVARLGRYLGTQTNNVAEYQGLLLGLQKALELGAREVTAKADSLLVISQLRGEWKVKHPGLKPYYEEAKALLRRFDKATLVHVRREMNTAADEMSNRAIDERM